MDAIKFVIIISTIFLLSAIPTTSRAQENILESFRTVEGQIAAGQSDVWIFEAREGIVVSFQAQAARSGNLDPIIVLSDDAGRTLARNDDYDFPSIQDAVLQAVTIPRTGTYTVTISGFDDTAGEYNLTMLNGFPEIVEQELFNDVTEWETSSDSLFAMTEAGAFVMAISGVQQNGIAIKKETEIVHDFYAQVNVEVTAGRPGWVVGMTARQQDNAQYYQLKINDSGLWQFVIRDQNDERIIRDWASHPAIVPGQAQFTLALMMRGAGIDIFYNNLFIGHIVDNTLRDAGSVGLSIGTGTAIGSETVVQFDNFIITTPIQTDNTEHIPDFIAPANPNQMVQNLRRQGIVPADSVIILTVPESFIESINPGVREIPLGNGVTASKFVMATDFSWRISGDSPAGCGLIFRAIDDTDFSLAYLDQTGTYGISRRHDEAFSSDLFGQLPTAQTSSHHLLVIATGSVVHYYIDGQFVGSANDELVEGTVGNAVINFESVSTSCQFADTWVLRWD
ncbi:MAG: hypothetical protein CUN54_06080 [Phototrophicales bacterium]|nr:MAG: hypothetical protein CUN54_06080 [Phototrophicales bacterium]